MKIKDTRTKVLVSFLSFRLEYPLGFGKVAFACTGSENMTILAGKIDNSVVEILTSESGVLRYEVAGTEMTIPEIYDIKPEGFIEFSGSLTDRNPNVLYGLILANYGGGN